MNRYNYDQEQGAHYVCVCAVLSNLRVDIIWCMCCGAIRRAGRRADSCRHQPLSIWRIRVVRCVALLFCRRSIVRFLARETNGDKQLHSRNDSIRFTSYDIKMGHFAPTHSRRRRKNKQIDSDDAASQSTSEQQQRATRTTGSSSDHDCCTEDRPRSRSARLATVVF